MKNQSGFEKTMSPYYVAHPTQRAVGEEKAKKPFSFERLSCFLGERENVNIMQKNPCGSPIFKGLGCKHPLSPKMYTTYTPISEKKAGGKCEK